MSDLAIKILAGLGALMVVVLLSFLLSWPVMWLWNEALVGAIDGVRAVSWLQAWGITILCGLLFKNHTSN